MASSDFFNISTFAYIMAMFAYLAYLAFRKNGVGYVATGITALGFVSQTIAIFVRWHESYLQWMRFSPESSLLLGISRSAPLRNLYESLVFFIWSMIIIYLVVEYVYKNRSLGAFVTPVAGLALAFIEMSGMSKDISPLVPALQSNWLIAHVLISFFGYGAFGVSFATANMHLIITTSDRKAPSHIFWALTFGFFLSALLAMAWKIGISPDMSNASVIWIVILAGLLLAGLALLFDEGLKKVLSYFSLSPDMLDDITYKSIAIGFPLLSLGIITGAIWADSAWGTYWSWDPKETWSLITWFVYALYLHSRFMRGWRGRKTAILSLIGFISVIFTYLGVNLLLSGLHSYGAG